MSDQDDQDALNTHVADQGIEGSKTIADMVNAFYNRLREHGWIHDTAFEMSQTWLTAWNKKGQNNEQD